MASNYSLFCMQVHNCRRAHSNIVTYRHWDMDWTHRG